MTRDLVHPKLLVDTQLLLDHPVQMIIVDFSELADSELVHAVGPDEVLDSFAVLSSHVDVSVEVEDMLLQQVEIVEFSGAQPTLVYPLHSIIDSRLLFLVDFLIVAVQLPLMGELLEADGAMELFRGRVLVPFAKMALD